MSTAQTPRSRAQTAQLLTRASGRLSTAALARMERDMPWVSELPAEDRSWIGLIVQAGVKAFIDWYRNPEGSPVLRAEVFGVAPMDMASEISLQQTVALVRLAVDVVDENLEEVLDEPDASSVRTSLNRYAREVAFATAEVYARAAEQRGAWDARLEALVVDSVLRGEAEETISSRASALGWGETGHVVVLVGGLGDGGSTLDDVRRVARERSLDCLCAVQGDRLVVVLGGVDRGVDRQIQLSRPVMAVADAFAPGPVVVGPVVAALTQAHESAEAAVAGLRVVHGWRQAPRPVLAEDLLPERVLAGEEAARQALVAKVNEPLSALGDPVLETLSTFLESGSSFESTARALYVHPNTVRYRLRNVAAATGLNPSDPRDSFTLRVALAVGRISR